MYDLQSSEILLYVSKNSCLHFGLHLTVIEQYRDWNDGLSLQKGAVDAVGAHNQKRLIEFAGNGAQAVKHSCYSHFITCTNMQNA